MKAYKELIWQVIKDGDLVEGRNGRTLEIFGTSLTVGPMEREFPIITSRKMFYKGVFGELAAFLKRPSNVTDFRAMGCNYWDQWADDQGNLKVDYGNAWQDFNGVNQLSKIADQIIQNPQSRRHLIIGWNPVNVDGLSLPCCHYAYQWNVTSNGHLNMLWIQRSADVMIGLPSDIIAGALFNILMAHTTGLIPGYVTFQLGSTHIYEEHMEHVRDYLDTPEYKLPTWAIARDETSVFDFKPSDVVLEDYEHGPVLNFLLKT